MDCAGPAKLGGVHLGELAVRTGKADSQAIDLAEPALAVGLHNAGGEVSRISSSRALGRVRLEERTSYTGLTELILKRDEWGAGAPRDSEPPKILAPPQQPGVSHVLCVPMKAASRRRGGRARLKSVFVSLCPQVFDLMACLFES